MEMADARSIQAWCVELVGRILDLPASEIDPDVEVDRLGLDSANAVALIMSLEEQLDMEIMPEILFEHSTLKALSVHLASRVGERGALEAPRATVRSA
jgi:acyl carrier protein